MLLISIYLFDFFIIYKIDIIQLLCIVRFTIDQYSWIYNTLIMVEGDADVCEFYLI